MGNTVDDRNDISSVTEDYYSVEHLANYLKNIGKDSEKKLTPDENIIALDKMQTALNKITIAKCTEMGALRFNNVGDIFVSINSWDLRKKLFKLNEYLKNDVITKYLKYWRNYNRDRQVSFIPNIEDIEMVTGISLENVKPIDSTYLSNQLDYMIEYYDNRQNVIVSNLQLVPNRVKQYNGKGIELMDLIMEGNFGLIRSISKFDLEKKCMLSTYAEMWIKQYAARSAMEDSKTIRIPFNMMERWRLYNTTSKKLTTLLDRTPTDEELRNELGWDLEEFQRVQECIDKFDNIISLDKPMDDFNSNNTETLGYYVADESQDVEKIVFNTILKKVLDEELNTLKPREREALIRTYYGEEKLDNMGRDWNLTKERVRQIKEKGLKKMRHPSRSKNFKNFL